jgi:hypothetical protein
MLICVQVMNFFLTGIAKCFRLKGIGSILFLKNGLKKFCRKNYKIISEEIIMGYVQL